MNELTPTQQSVFEFVRDSIDEHGWAPTTREIQAHFTHSSATTAADALNALESKGYISRLKINGKPSSRAITILK